MADDLIPDEEFVPTPDEAAAIHAKHERLAALWERLDEGDPLTAMEAELRESLRNGTVFDVDEDDPWTLAGAPRFAIVADAWLVLRWVDTDLHERELAHIRRDEIPPPTWERIKLAVERQGH